MVHQFENAILETIFQALEKLFQVRRILFPGETEEESLKKATLQLCEILDEALEGSPDESEEKESLFSIIKCLEETFIESSDPPPPLVEVYDPEDEDE